MAIFLLKWLLSLPYDSYLYFNESKTDLDFPGYIQIRSFDLFYASLPIKEAILLCNNNKPNFKSFYLLDHNACVYRFIYKRYHDWSIPLQFICNRLHLEGTFFRKIQSSLLIWHILISLLPPLLLLLPLLLFLLFLLPFFFHCASDFLPYDFLWNQFEKFPSLPIFQE